MRHLFSGILFLCVFHSTLAAQGAVVTGTIGDRETREVIAGATVSLLPSARGSATDNRGYYRVGNLPPGTYTLRASSIGYESFDSSIDLSQDDSLFIAIELQPSEIETEEVVVTGTRTVRSIADVPVRVEAIPQEEVEEKLLMTPSNVAMLLNESTGMRVQTTSATAGTANLRIQGLSGRYTSILTDGIPNFGGLASGFSITQIPPLDLRQVEVVKGAGSALYGPDAIAGIVNFLSKHPTTRGERQLLANVTSQNGFDAAGYYGKLHGGVGLTGLASYNRQPLTDVDGDGYGDVSGFERFTVKPGFIFYPARSLEVSLKLGYSSESREGGFTDPNLPSSFLDLIESSRFDASGSLAWRVKDGSSLTSKFAGMNLVRDATYDGIPFNATQRIFYQELQYEQTLDAHRILFGGAVVSDNFDERSASPLTRDYRFLTAGAFAQDEIALSNRWTVLAGARIDHQNRYGLFFTPRTSLMFKPSERLTLRAGGGTGFRAPTIFVEEAEELGFHAVRPLSDVDVERTKSLSFDLNWNQFYGAFGVTLNFAAYYTELQNALIVNPDSILRDIVFLESADGLTRSRGGELAVKVVMREFKLSLGYTYIFSTQHDRARSTELALNPRHSIGTVLFWESEEQEMKAGLENYWTGAQRTERNPYRETTPAFWITGFIAEKRFGILRVFVNFENMFDTRQTRFDPLLYRSGDGAELKSVPVYAPVEGRAVNGGLRLVW